MKPLHFLIAIQRAKSDGLDYFAAELMQLHDKLWPDEPSLRAAQASQTLRRLNERRVLTEVEPL